MDPVRVCCGQRHSDIQCPDGLVMCCICFDRVPIDHLMMEGNSRIDICDKHPEEVKEHKSFVEDLEYEGGHLIVKIPNKENNGPS